MYKILFIILIIFGCTNTDKPDSISQFEEYNDPILAPYFEIVEALSKDNFERAKMGGKQLSKASSDTGVKLALVRMGQLLNEASSLYNQRAILEQLGMVIPLYIDESVTNKFVIYKFKCINEFDGKEVVWLGISAKTRNPFIGGNSNECIELVEKIQPIIKD